MSRYIEYHDICSAICNQQDGTGMTYEALAHAMVEIQLAPSIEIIRCKECKHRPIKEDAEGADYGFNISAPNGDERCPCLVEDGWYSWMPNDNFYCGFGERKESE